ncbi:MAG: hypothetical protein ACYTHK_15085 [Planctomycetota bacterium]|jgi:hypothetical protein
MLLLLVLATIGLAAAPSMLSTAGGREWLMGRVSAAIPGRLAGDQLELGWGRGQSLKGLRLVDRDGAVVGSCRELDSDLALWDLLRGEFGPGKLVLRGVELDLAVDDEGRLNLGGALAEPDDEPSRPLEEMLREFEIELPDTLDLTVELEDARISFRSPEMTEPLTLEGVGGRLQVSAGRPVACELAGRFGGTAPVQLAAQLTGLDESGTLRGSGAGLSLTLDGSWEESTHRVLRLLRRAAGDSARVSASLVTTPDAISLEFDVTSPRLSAEGGARALLGEERALVLTRPLAAKVEITPELVGELAESTLRDVVPLELSLEEVRLPLDRPELTGSSFRGKAKLGDGSVELRGETFAWRGWSASFDKGVEDQDWAFALDGAIETRDEEGRVTARGRAGSELEELQAKVERFPLAPLDRMIVALTGHEGALVEALGPRLDLEAAVDPTGPGRADAKLQAKTDRLTLQAPLHVDWKGRVATGRGIELEYAMAPSLLQRVAGERVPLPDADVAVKLRIASFAAPYARFDPAKTELDAHLEVGPGRLGGDPELSFRDVAAQVKAAAAGVSIDLRGRLGVGDFGVTGTVRELWDEEGAFQPGRVDGKLVGLARGLPLAAIDRQVKKEPGLRDLLGPELECGVRLDGDGRSVAAVVHVTSRNLRGSVPLALEGQRVRLTEPSRLQAAIEPAVAERFGQVQLDARTPVALELREFSMPWRSARSAGIRAVARVRAGKFTVERDGNELTVEKIDAMLGGDSVAAATLSLNGAVRVGGLAGTALGGTTTIDADAALADLDPDRVEASLRSPLASLDFAIRREGDHFVLVRPLTGSYELRPALLAEVGWRDDLLGQPAKIALQMTALAVPLDFSLDGLTAQAEVEVPDLLFALRDEPRLRDLVATLSVGKELRLDLTAKGSSRDKEEAGGIKVQGTVREWLRDGKPDVAAPLTLDARLSAIPTALFGLEMVGDSADASLVADLPRRPAAGRVDLVVKAEHLDVSAQLAADDRVSLTRPARVRWTLTPEAARTLGLNRSLELADPATVEFTVQKFTMTREGERPALQAHAAVGALDFTERKGREVVIGVERLRLDLASEDLRDAVSIELRGKVTGSGEPGALAGTVRVTQMAKSGNLRDASVSGDVRVEAVPVGPLDRLLGMEGHLHAVMGDRARLRARSQLDQGVGPLDLELTSHNLTAKVAARATRTAFYLREPVTAELRHSERLAELVLPKLGPFFEGIVKTEQPIRFRIESRGFSVPRPFSLAKVNLPSASVDVGRVVLANQMIVDVIKSLARAGVPEKTEAWFTPLMIEMRDGRILYRRRLDVLFDDRIHLGTWGAVDIPNDRLDMVFTLMPETVRDLLRIGDGKTDTLQIPIRGSLKRPRVDLRKPLADIGAIQAKEAALRKAPPLVQAIAKAALDELTRKAFGGLPPKDASVDPLPWREN